MSQPYQPPSKKEVKASGTADWVKQAVDHHSQKQARLAQVFSDSDRALQEEKDQLAQMWNSPPQADEALDRGPDLFAQERQKVEAQKRQLAGVWDQDLASKQAEEEELRNLFGSPAQNTRGKKKR